jgi:hypothetical protein
VGANCETNRNGRNGYDGQGEYVSSSSAHVDFLLFDFDKVESLRIIFLSRIASVLFRQHRPKYLMDCCRHRFIARVGKIRQGDKLVSRHKGHHPLGPHLMTRLWRSTPSSPN